MNSPLIQRTLTLDPLVADQRDAFLYDVRVLIPDDTDQADYTAIIEGELTKHKSPYAGTGNLFTHYARWYGVDPLFMLSIFWMETAYGTQGTVNTEGYRGYVNNPFSIVYDTRRMLLSETKGVYRVQRYWADFGSKSAGIEAGFKLIKDYYYTQDQYTIGDIMWGVNGSGVHAYANKPASNDTPLGYVPNLTTRTLALYSKLKTRIETRRDMTVKAPQMEWIGSPNHTPGREGYKPEAIVLHIAQGTLEGMDSWFQQTKDKKRRVSSHFAIGYGGDIHQYVRTVDTAWTNGFVNKPTWSLLKPGDISPNLYTISIEHEGWSDETDWTPAMLEADIDLISYLCNYWKIPADREHIIGHNRIDGVDRSFCPGSKCPMAAIIQGVVQRLAPPVPEKPREPTIDDVRGVSQAHEAALKRIIRHNELAIDELRAGILPDESTLQWSVDEAKAALEGQWRTD